MNISNRNNTNPMQLSHKTEKTEFPNSFYEVSIIPVKPKRISRKLTIDKYSKCF